MVAITVGLCAWTHDSSVALFVGSELICFLEEDRLAGIKHTKAFPTLALEQALASTGVAASDVDCVAYNFSRSLYAEGAERAQQRLGPAARRRRGVRSYAAIAEAHARNLSSLSSVFQRATIEEVPHHDAHAFCGLAFTSGDDCDVLVVDSIGEAVTTSVGAWRGPVNGLCLTPAAWDTDSLGYLYGAVTDHLGFKMRDEEGTVMALAALGDPERFRSVFSEILSVRNGIYLSLSPKYLRQRIFGDSGMRLTELFANKCCPRRRANEAIQTVHCDLAAALQECVELCLLRLTEVFERDALVIVGGVATNCVAMGRVRDAKPHVDVTIPPTPGDSGTAIGAAISSIFRHTAELPLVKNSPFLGCQPALPTLDFLRSQNGMSTREFSIEGLARDVAERLAVGQVVGVFRGRAEAGPRALGHRSILADPTNGPTVNRLAREVKRREAFRPFAPVARASEAAGYVDLRGGESPYMSFALPALPALLRDAPAVVHVDGTTRLQTVAKGSDEFLERVLMEFTRITGRRLLINTSLNGRGEPTVGSWQQAVECFSRMSLDALVVGDYLIESTVQNYVV